jgi:hypothetical protein
MLSRPRALPAGFAAVPPAGRGAHRGGSIPLLRIRGAASGDDMNLTSACAAERVLGTPREILGAPPMCKG